MRTLALTFVHVCNGRGALRGTLLYHAGEGSSAPVPGNKTAGVQSVVHYGAMWAFRVRAAQAALRAAPRDKAALAALRFELRNWRTTLRQAPAEGYEATRRSYLGCDGPSPACAAVVSARRRRWPGSDAVGQTAGLTGGYG